VTNTATQIQMIEALGGTVPSFAHHSLLTGPQGEALSKRLGTLALRDLRKRGIAPMAILSLMARLGSSDPVELRETVEEVVGGFDLAKFGSAPTKFDSDDLEPLTHRWIAARPYADVAGQIRELGVPDSLAEPFWNAVKGNIKRFAEMADWWHLFYEGGHAVVEDEDREFVETALGLLGDPPYAADAWSSWTGAVKDATGRKGKGLFMPLRLAVTGKARGPEMADVMPLLQVKPKA
jgi:glutamyl-tRNA synthetase